MTTIKEEVNDDRYICYTCGYEREFREEDDSNYRFGVISRHRALYHNGGTTTRMYMVTRND